MSVIAKITDKSVTFQLKVVKYSIGIKKYVQALWERCFEENKLNVNCLTLLDIDLPFNHAFRLFGDPKKAFDECKLMIEQLKNLIDKYDNLDVRYIKDPHGMDVIISEDYQP